MFLLSGSGKSLVYAIKIGEHLSWKNCGLEKSKFSPFL